MLRTVEHYGEFKEAFASKFSTFLGSNPAFRDLSYDLFVSGTAYVVGGFLRDIINQRESRDLDIMIALPHEEILKSLQRTGVSYSVNRMAGVKLNLSGVSVDLWSIDNNWAFRNNLVKQNEDYILENIADGCFYNYDALVINVHKRNNLSVNNYNKCVRTNTLDIIQKNRNYKLLNPTIEANILRAFYLKSKHNLGFSKNCSRYLVSRIHHLRDKHGTELAPLLKSRDKYPKYQNKLSEVEIQRFILQTIHENGSNEEQGHLEF